MPDPAVVLLSPPTRRARARTNSFFLAALAPSPSPPSQPRASEVKADHWVPGVLARIDALTRLPLGWIDDAEPPSEACARVARMLVGELAREALRPHHVAPVADGGIELEFQRGARDASLEVANDGEVVLTTRPSPQSPAEYVDVVIDDAISSLAAFLRAP